MTTWIMLCFGGIFIKCRFQSSAGLRNTDNGTQPPLPVLYLRERRRGIGDGRYRVVDGGGCSSVAEQRSPRRSRGVRYFPGDQTARGHLHHLRRHRRGHTTAPAGDAPSADRLGPPNFRHALRPVGSWRDSAVPRREIACLQYRVGVWFRG